MWWGHKAATAKLLSPLNSARVRFTAYEFNLLFVKRKLHSFFFPKLHNIHSFIHSVSQISKFFLFHFVPFLCPKYSSNHQMFLRWTSQRSLIHSASYDILSCSRDLWEREVRLSKTSAYFQTMFPVQLIVWRGNTAVCPLMWLHISSAVLILDNQTRMENA